MDKVVLPMPPGPLIAINLVSSARKAASSSSSSCFRPARSAIGAGTVRGVAARKSPDKADAARSAFAPGGNAQRLSASCASTEDWHCEGWRYRPLRSAPSAWCRARPEANAATDDRERSPRSTVRKGLERSSPVHAGALGSGALQSIRLGGQRRLNDRRCRYRARRDLLTPSSEPTAACLWRPRSVRVPHLQTMAHARAPTHRAAGPFLPQDQAPAASCELCQRNCASMSVACITSRYAAEPVRLDLETLGWSLGGDYGAEFGNSGLYHCTDACRRTRPPNGVDQVGDRYEACRLPERGFRAKDAAVYAGCGWAVDCAKPRSVRGFGSSAPRPTPSARRAKIARRQFDVSGC